MGASSPSQTAWIVLLGFLTAQLCWIEAHLDKATSFSAWFTSRPRTSSWQARMSPIMRLSMIKVDTFHAEAIKASGNQFPRIAALLTRGSQSVSAGAQGGTGNQKFSPKGCRNVRQDGQPGLGTRTESNLFELVVSNQGVVILHCTAQTKRGCCVCHRRMTG